MKPAQPSLFREIPAPVCCRVCGRRLKHHKTIARGVGPKCEKKEGKRDAQ